MANSAEMVEIPALLVAGNQPEFTFQARTRIGELKWVLTATDGVGLAAPVPAGASISTLPVDEACRAFLQSLAGRDGDMTAVDLQAARTQSRDGRVLPWRPVVEGQVDLPRVVFENRTLGVDTWVELGEVHGFSLTGLGGGCYLLASETAMPFSERALSLGLRDYRRRASRRPERFPRFGKFRRQTYP